jgi:hypothetical protein
MPAKQRDLREERLREAHARLTRVNKKIHALAERFSGDTFFRAEVARIRTYLELLIQKQERTDAR